MKKIVLHSILFALLLAVLSGCQDVVEPAEVWPGEKQGLAAQVAGTPVTRKMSYPAYTAKDGTWAIYMYICGADLESKDPDDPKDGYGLASADISEAVKVKLPENVNLIMQTGGALNWANKLDATVLSRIWHGAEGTFELTSAPQANMGDPNTLAEFLAFCNTNFPAEHQVVILWDHGGGSLFGYASDENFDHDGMSLPELNAAFDAAPAASGKYEIVGFDACLMATIDVVATLQDYANYLVASEELESGAGWYYTGALEALVKDTTQPAASFAKAICDTFYQELLDLKVRNSQLNLHQDATLSVIDLNKADTLLKAYQAMADEALLMAVDRKEEYLSQFARAARASENYGYNTPEDGFFEMVDMGDLARNAANLLPESRAKVEAALAECVIYQVKGPLRSKASGVSCYYCYSGSPISVAEYHESGSSKAVGYYHEYSLSGSLSQEGLQYVNDIGRASNQPAPVVEELALTEELGFTDFPITLGPDGRWRLELGPSRVKSVAAVYNYMLWDNGTSDGVSLQVLFGVSDEVDADWQNGVFTERYTGIWGCIDDAQVYMRAVSAGDGYILYSCPILLNGSAHSMFVSLEHDSLGRKQYTILGVRKTSEDIAKRMVNKELAPKDMVGLQPGDVLEPIHYFMIREGDNDWRRDGFSVQSITVGENPHFYEKSLGDGHFKLMFSIVDYAGNEYLSQAGDYKVKEGRIERVLGWEVYPQPQRTIKGISLQKHTGVDGIYYTTILDYDLFETNWQALQLPGRGPDFSVEVFSYEDDVHFDEYVGERTVYLQGGFSDGRRTRNTDMVFEVTGIMAGEGGKGGENPSGSLAEPQMVFGNEPTDGAPLILTISGGEVSNSEVELLELAESVVELLKNKDWGALGSLVHPKLGVAFSPWGLVEIEKCVKLGMGDVKALDYDDAIRSWGIWPSGRAMEYIFDAYYDAFIFDRDYTKPSKIGVSRIVRSSGSGSNLDVFGNSGAFIDFYAQGAGASAEDNWGSLQVVFSWFEGDSYHESGLYLVAIVHDGNGS